jgi:hypothetical protein
MKEENAPQGGGRGCAGYTRNSTAIPDRTKLYSTWALPLLKHKQKLLNGEHVTQSGMLAETGGTAWRLSAAVYHLSRHGWNIQRYDRGRIRVYYVDHREIQRLRTETGGSDRGC